jgi:hypothetical protein
MNNNVDNYVVTATGTTPELNGELNLQFDGTTLVQEAGSILGSTPFGGIASLISTATLASFTGGDKYTGETMLGSSADQITYGSLVVMDGATGGNNMIPTWYLADATGSQKTRAENMLGIALNSATPGAQLHVLLYGFVSNAYAQGSADNGVPLYMSDTPGQITRTPPSGTGEYVRLIGYVFSTDWPVIRFWPDNTWVRI